MAAARPAAALCAMSQGKHGMCFFKEDLAQARRQMRRMS